MIQQRAAHHFRALDLPDVEVSLVLCDDEVIHELNRTWRDVDAPTDVLSFPLFEPLDPEMLDDEMPIGDVVISVEYAERLVAGAEHRARVAEELGVDPASLTWGLEEEVEFLFIHGLLHLLGHDHMDAAEEAEMKAAERALWLSSRASQG